MDNKALTGLTQTLEAAELVKAMEIIEKIRKTDNYSVRCVFNTDIFVEISHWSEKRGHYSFYLRKSQTLPGAVFAAVSKLPEADRKACGLEV